MNAKNFILLELKELEARGERGREGEVSALSQQSRQREDRPPNSPDLAARALTQLSLIRAVRYFITVHCHLCGERRGGVRVLHEQIRGLCSAAINCRCRKLERRYCAPKPASRSRPRFAAPSSKDLRHDRFTLQDEKKGNRITGKGREHRTYLERRFEKA